VISQASIQEVLDAAAVEHIIQEHVRLKRSGRNLKGLCPFHNEKTPSFMVSPDKNIYKCFGCGKAGGPVQFLMDLEGLSFPEAIRNLAARYGVKLEEDGQEDRAEFAERDSLFIVNEYARDHYRKQLMETDLGRSVGLSYFKERGFLESTIEKFQLGYSTEQKDDLVKAALSDGHTLDRLESCGLTNQYGGDFFRSRVIFPIQSAGGKILGFAGRILSADPKAPKYINTRETEIYNKRRVLYGMFQARQDIRRLDQCIIVEGYTDVMSLHQYEVRNVVAASGTSLTEEQCSLIKRHTENVLLIFDGDAAGLKAAMRGLDIVLAEGLHPMIIVLPDGEDPDSLVRDRGTDAFLQYLKDTATDFIVFKSNLLLEETENRPIQRARAYQDIAASIAKIPNAMTRSLYAQDCASRFSIEEGHMLEEINKALAADNKLRAIQRKRDTRPSDPSSPMELATGSGGNVSADPVDADLYHERNLARVLLLYGDQLLSEEPDDSVAAFIVENIQEELDSYDDELSLSVLRQYIESYNQGTHLRADSFYHHEDEKLRQFVIDLTTSPHTYSHNWEDMLENSMLNQPHPDKNYETEATEILLRLKMRKLSKTIDELMQELSTLEDADEDTIQLKLNFYQRLMLERNAIAEQLRHGVMT